jgi:hypothetical protein
VRTQSRDCDPRYGKGLKGRKGEKKEKKKERFWQLETFPFFSPLLLTSRGWQLERLLRGPRPVTDRFPAPRSSTRTSSSIMPQHPPSPPSDSASTHSVGTDTDSGISACFASMMVNRPVLKKYNEYLSGPPKVADTTRTHMIAVKKPNRDTTRTHMIAVKKPNREAAPAEGTQAHKRTAKSHTHAHAHTHTFTHTHTHTYTYS